MTWNIEVATAGRYEAVVYYTCRERDAGSVMELEFNGARIESDAIAAHDPPLVGAEYDRTPRRGESYVKDFKPLRLGVMQLAQGRGELSLRALRIPGSAAIDVRYVVLTLQAEGP